MDKHMAKTLLSAATDSLPTVKIVDIYGDVFPVLLVDPAFDLLDNAIILTLDHDDGIETHVCNFDKIERIQIATRRNNLLLSIFIKGD